MGYGLPPTGLVRPGGEMIVNPSKQKGLVVPRWTSFQLLLTSGLANYIILSSGIGLWVDDSTAGAIATVNFDADPTAWNIFAGHMIPMQFQKMTFNAVAQSNAILNLKWTNDPETLKLLRS